MAKPSLARLKEASAELLIFNPTSIALPSGEDMSAEFKPVADDPTFSQLAFGVMDYGVFPPKTFLHNPDVMWNGGSMNKVAIAAGAFALRRDVQALKDKDLISTVAEADDIMRFVWSISPNQGVKTIGQPPFFPVPSKIFEIRGSEVIFQGERDTEDFPKLKSWHDGGGGTIQPSNLARATFWEWMILMMKPSDNRAARAVQGVLGTGYNSRVMDALGLFSSNPAAYGGLRTAGTYASNPPYKDLGQLRQPKEYFRGWPKGSIGISGKQKLPYAATTRTLAALMNAIVGDKFLSVTASTQFNRLMREAIDFSTASFAAEAIKRIPASIRAWTKVGVWKNYAELNRIETTDGKLNYGFVILGLPFTVEGNELDKRLARRIHEKMESIHP
jgi:hypothetical protein